MCFPKMFGKQTPSSPPKCERVNNTHLPEKVMAVDLSPAIPIPGAITLTRSRLAYAHRPEVGQASGSELIIIPICVRL